ncbi:MAG TPA: hypothetical protein PK413_08910 [Thermoanaerobaculia bacterium]|nr:hypothetical protein [Thermoanaerobaculia bacterium]
MKNVRLFALTALAVAWLASPVWAEGAAIAAADPANVAGVPAPAIAQLVAPEPQQVSTGLCDARFNRCVYWCQGDQWCIWGCEDEWIACLCSNDPSYC